MERRQIDGALRRLADLEIIRVSGHAHDFIRLGFAVTGDVIESDMLSDGICACEVVAGQGLIDDRQARVRLVVESEFAPGEERRSQRLKVLGRNIRYRNPAAILGPFLVTLDGGKAAGPRA